MLQFTGIIPARYGSTRFPGKPLVIIKGKSMIERVYLQARKVISHVYVATDDTRIESEVHRFGGKVIMTSPLHQSGTDRCAEAIRIIQQESGINFNVVINIQGDEPFIQPEHLLKLMVCFENSGTQIATLVKPVQYNDDIFNPNYVKVVIDRNNNALFFSRSAVPFLRNFDRSIWLEHHPFYQHLGIYAYRTDVLTDITKLPQSSLELAESLEQLRWLENGYRVHIEQTEFGNLAVDTPEDLVKLNLLDIPE